MSEYDNRKDVKYQLFVTAQMDNEIQQCAQIMGMRKNEFVRYCIAQGIAGYRTTVDILKEQIEKEMAKGKREE